MELSEESSLEIDFNILHLAASHGANRGDGSASPARDRTVDRGSFDRLMLEHLSAAHRLAIRLSGDVDRAEELVQEAMLRASRSWSGFRGQSKFTTWLFAIVINVF